MSRPHRADPGQLMGLRDAARSSLRRWRHRNDHGCSGGCELPDGWFVEEALRLGDGMFPLRAARSSQAVVSVVEEQSWAQGRNASAGSPSIRWVADQVEWCGPGPRTPQ